MASHVESGISTSFIFGSENGAVRPEDARHDGFGGRANRQECTLLVLHKLLTISLKILVDSHYKSRGISLRHGFPLVETSRYGKEPRYDTKNFLTYVSI